MKLYYDHIIPETMPVGVLHRLVMLEIAQQFPKDLDVLIMGFDGYIPDNTELRKIYPDFNAKHKIAVSLFDAMAINETKATALLGDFIPLSMSTYQSYSLMAHHCYNTFYDLYYQADFPLKLNNLFLFYNRKPKPFRIDLVRKMQDANIDENGIITLGVYDKYEGREGANETLLTLSENDNITHLNAPEGRNAAQIPNDYTLGNMDIWDSHFVNITSEVTLSEIYFSEKIFKPIMGKRPFILNGPSGGLDLLKQWGFKTFDKYWDESYNTFTDYHESHDKIMLILGRLSTLNDTAIIEMYNDMNDILEFNHNHFFTTFNDLNRKGLAGIYNTFKKHYL